MKFLVVLFMIFCCNGATSADPGLKSKQSLTIDIVNSSENVVSRSLPIARDGLKGIVLQTMQYTSQYLEELGINNRCTENLHNPGSPKIEISILAIERASNSEKHIAYSYTIKHNDSVLFQEDDRSQDDNFDEICRKIGKKIASTAKSILDH